MKYSSWLYCARGNGLSAYNGKATKKSTLGRAPCASRGPLISVRKVTRTCQRIAREQTSLYPIGHHPIRNFRLHYAFRVNLELTPVAEDLSDGQMVFPPSQVHEATAVIGVEYRVAFLVGDGNQRAIRPPNTFAVFLDRTPGIVALAIITGGDARFIQSRA